MNYELKPAAYYIRGGDIMTGFIIGTMVGGTVGVFAMCMCTAAKIADIRNGTE